MKPGTDKIRFHFTEGPVYFPNRTPLKFFLLELFKREGQEVEAINYIFCSDEYLLQVNRDHLKHDFYTDIITFPLSSKGAPILSDIYISVDRVRENARTYHTTFGKELHRVIFHGALHLCGYKDKTKKEAGLMRQKEAEYLRLYFVPRGTRGVPIISNIRS